MLVKILASWDTALTMEGKNSCLHYMRLYAKYVICGVNSFKSAWLSLDLFELLHGKKNLLKQKLILDWKDKVKLIVGWNTRMGKLVDKLLFTTVASNQPDESGGLHQLVTR